MDFGVGLFKNIQPKNFGHWPFSGFVPKKYVFLDCEKNEEFNYVSNKHKFMLRNHTYCSITLNDNGIVR